MCAYQSTDAAFRFGLNVLCSRRYHQLLHTRLAASISRIVGFTILRPQFVCSGGTTGSHEKEWIILTPVLSRGTLCNPLEDPTTT